MIKVKMNYLYPEEILLDRCEPEAGNTGKFYKLVFRYHLSRASHVSLSVSDGGGGRQGGDL